MRKRIFTFAFAALAAVCLSAQGFNKTISVPDGGVSVGSSQYHAVTDLIQLDEPVSAIRYTVSRTETDRYAGPGGPYFSLAELSVLDASGNKISYTATSNSEHEVLTGMDEGDGIPALNSNSNSDWFHSIWLSSSTVVGYHWIELTFDTPISEFKLDWYSRRLNGNDRPLVVGVTPVGQDFVPFKEEYGYTLGEKVASVSDINADDVYVFKVEAPADTLPDGVASTGDGYISLRQNTANVSHTKEAIPTQAMRILPAENEGEFYVYTPANGAFFNDYVRRYTGMYNGANGWQYAGTELNYALPVKLTLREDGDYEISCTVTGYYVQNEGWVSGTTTFYIGYDPRGSLKIFEQEGKEALENGQYGEEYPAKFAYPVDFGFTIIKAEPVATAAIPSISLSEITSVKAEASRRSLIDIVNNAKTVYDTYINKIEDFGLGEDEALLDAIEAAAADTITGTTATKDVLDKHIDDVNLNGVYYVWLYIDQISNKALELYNDNSIFCSLSDLVEGKYPEDSKEILQQVTTKAGQVSAAMGEGVITTISAATDEIAGLEAMMNTFYDKKIARSTFPVILENMPNTLEDNHRMWTSGLFILNEAVDGIRMTVLKTNSGHANFGYEYPVLSEVELYDAEGNKITLPASSFSSNSVHSGEGSLDNLGNGVYDWADGVSVGNYPGLDEYWHATWAGTNYYDPVTYVYLDVQFPSPMSVFKVKLVGRNISGNRDQQFPTTIAVSKVGDAYDPMVYAPNPYNVGVEECTQITEVSQITDEGIYAIRGLLNTNPEIIADTVLAKEYWYTDVVKYHTSVLNSEVPYFINKTDDGKYTIQSLFSGKYWPSVVGDVNEATLAGELTGFVSSTPYKKNAAKLNIVPATSGIEGSFVLYEENDKVYAEVAEVDITGDTSYVNVNTPYAVYMDWYSGLAVRPVRDPQPWGGDNLPEELKDSWGDSLHFNKKNGEGQWKIYKISMDTPYTFWLGNLVSVMDGVGYRQGEDPGCVNVAGLAEALAAAQAVVADTVSEADVKETNAKTAALNLVAAYDEVANAERKPMIPGTYMIVSAYDEYYKQQNEEKAIFEDPQGGIKWGTIPVVNEEGATDGAYCFEFIESPYREDYVMNGMFSEEDAAKIYIIKNVATGKFVGGAEAMSTGFVTVDEADATGYMVSEAAGSSFLIRNIANAGWNMHTAGHGNGAGPGGEIVYWSSTEGASTWYLQSVTMDETSIGDLVVEGDEVVSVTYYTVGGAASSTPVKGVNIVKVVYANGAVETKKVIVE